jgi:hypothetical protein
MPIVDTANGPVFVADGAPPDVIARIQQQHGGTPRAVRNAPAKLNADQQDVQRRVAEMRKSESSVGSTTGGILRHLVNGFTFNHTDEIGGALHAATSGVAHALQHGNLSEIGREYRNERDAMRQRDKETEGTGSTIAEIAGALVNPIGTGAKILQAAKFAPRVANIGMRLERAPAVVQGIVAGGNQGALNAAGNATDSSDMLTKVGQGFLTGAIGGGALGAAGTGARRAVQIMRDRAPAAAERIASTKIGNMLDKARITPQRAERELAVTNARGGDGMVQDMSPGLRAQAGALARRPEVPTSNDLINRGEDRILSRPDRFDAELKARVGNADAGAHIEGITAARKAHGDTDYKAALDGKFHWDANLQKFLNEAPPEMHAAMRDGAHLASLYDQDIGKLGMKVQPDGSVIMDTTPSMRVFDYAKRAMDSKISAAYKAGDMMLRGRAVKPAWQVQAAYHGRQPGVRAVYSPRSAITFKSAQATELGLNVVSRLKAEPKKVLADLRALDPSKHDDARTGIADALIARARRSKTLWRMVQASMARTPEQRKVLEFAFNGKGNLEPL